MMIVAISGSLSASRLQRKEPSSEIVLFPKRLQEQMRNLIEKRIPHIETLCLGLIHVPLKKLLTSACLEIYSLDLRRVSKRYIYLDICFPNPESSISMAQEIPHFPIKRFIVKNP